MRRTPVQRRPVMLAVSLALALLVPAMATAGGEEPFEYMPSGELVPGSGQGRFDETVYAPNMRFPLEEGPAYSNSQVWGNGGSQGPGGGQCDAVNYSYPWWDNYCETRSWDMPLCPAGVGHQGQDIRPATCEDGVHWTVASEAGMVTNIGSYSVYVTTPEGIRYDYLHGSGNIVTVGQQVAQGERINRVSNAFGGTPTTIHLHFNIRQDVSGVGFVYVPTYLSLVEAYQELFGLIGSGRGVLETQNSDCGTLVGWAQNDDEPEAPATVQVYFDGPPGDPEAIGVEVVADLDRPDLCEDLGSCNHGFSLEVPLRLRDGTPHDVYAFLVGTDGALTELDSSPYAFTCPAPALPEGVRRLVDGPEVVSAWGFSPLYQFAQIADADLLALDEGDEFPRMPVLVVSDADPEGVRWLMDPGYRRPVDSAEVATAWGLEWNDAAVWPASVLEDIPEGTPLRAAPFMAETSDGSVYVIDDAQCPLALDPSCEDGNGGETSAEGGEETTTGTLGDGGTGVDTASGGQTDGAGGCGCTQAPGLTNTWWLVVLLGWPRRRQRSNHRMRKPR